MIENFIPERWNMLSDDLKVSVACRFLEQPHFSAIVEATQLPKMKVHSALNRLTDLCCFPSKDEWGKTDHSWVLLYRYSDRNTVGFIDTLIRELTK